MGVSGSFKQCYYCKTNVLVKKDYFFSKKYVVNSSYNAGIKTIKRFIIFREDIIDWRKCKREITNKIFRCPFCGLEDLFNVSDRSGADYVLNQFKELVERLKK